MRLADLAKDHTDEVVEALFDAYLEERRKNREIRRVWSKWNEDRANYDDLRKAMEEHT